MIDEMVSRSLMSCLMNGLEKLGPGFLLCGFSRPRGDGREFGQRKGSLRLGP